MSKFDFSALATTGMKVTFTKLSNGEKRTMRCTTNLASIPTEKHPKGKMPSQVELGTVRRVFDLDKGAWRSFDEATVLSAEAL